MLHELANKIDENPEFVVEVLKMIVKAGESAKAQRNEWTLLMKTYVPGSKPNLQKSRMEVVATLAERAVKRWGGQK